MCCGGGGGGGGVGVRGGGGEVGSEIYLVIYKGGVENNNPLSGGHIFC